MTTVNPPVEFPLPADLQGFWQWDKIHGPRPMTPLTQDVWVDSLTKGFGAAMEEFAYPLIVAFKNVNYYLYATLIPAELGHESMEQRTARFQATMARVLPAIGDLWQKDWLPSILPGIERTMYTDYAALSDQQLADTFDELVEEQFRRYIVHGKINVVMLSASQFADFYNAKLHPEDSTEPYHVLQGFPTRSLDAGRGLWRLRSLIKASPALSALFHGSEPQQIIEALKASPEGQAFLAEFASFLEEFGWRSDAFEMAEPSWRENPAIPLNTLQGYLSLGDVADPDVRFQASVAQRERLLAAARGRLAASPEDLAAFEALYDAARWYLTIVEDHNYYIDQIGDRVMRLPALELGRRLVQRSAVERVDDVFFLNRVEIRAGLNGADQHALVAQRVAEMRHFGQIVPLPVIGAPPPPQDGPPDPSVEAMMKYAGMPPEPSSDAAVIAGIPASRGSVQARARVVRTLEEASKIEPGDVLVCEMTMPPWTPLFSTVSAVVADTGGVLSHCAIVSREYGIPCVVGTVVGTRLLEDGMLITVDGSKGIVRIDARA